MIKLSLTRATNVGNFNNKFGRMCKKKQTMLIYLTIKNIKVFR